VLNSVALIAVYTSYMIFTDGKRLHFIDPAVILVGLVLKTPFLKIFFLIGVFKL